MNNKIIFLDVDGVLNRFPPHPGDATSWPPKREETIDDITTESLGWLPEPVSIIVDLVKNHGCKIVISSTWRSYMSMVEFEKGLGLPTGSVIGKTKSLIYGRGQEIELWIKENNHTDPFVIIDDDVEDIECCSSLIDHIVRTKTHIGLIEGHLPKIITCLEVPNRVENDDNQESVVN